MTTLSYTALYRALRAEGINVVKVKGSRSRCRCHKRSHQLGGPKIRTWSDTLGVMVHITAGNLGKRTVLEYIRDIINGDPDLPCKYAMIVAPDGTLYLNSAGRTNHAGGIGVAAFKAYQSESWSLENNYDDRRGSSVDGNAHTLGLACINAGPPNDAQQLTCVRAAAAVARATKRSGRATAGHGECSNARTYADPGLDMAKFRKAVIKRRKVKV